MPAESTRPLHPHLSPQRSRILPSIIPSQQVSSSASRGSSAQAITTSVRPQREAATIARKRVEDAYTLYPSEQDPDSDSDATSTGLNAPRHITVRSDDSSDSDAFVDDSESDCPRQRKGALGKKRKRSASSMMDVGAKRKLKAGKLLEVGDRSPRRDATGFMVKSGNAIKDILRGKASRASRDSLSGPAERVHGENRSRYVRRAGLSDMGPMIDGYMSSWRDEVWAKEPEGFALESRKGGARGPVDGDRYRASRFSEHL